MQFLLRFICVFCFVGAGLVFWNSTTVFHEMLAALLLLVGVVAAVGIALLERRGPVAPAAQPERASALNQVVIPAPSARTGLLFLAGAVVIALAWYAWLWWF